MLNTEEGVKTPGPEVFVWATALSHVFLATCLTSAKGMNEGAGWHGFPHKHRPFAPLLALPPSYAFSTSSIQLAEPKKQ